MAQIFDETKIQRQNAIFDVQRLNYLNSQWIKKLDNETLFDKLKAFLPDSWKTEKEKTLTILNLVKDRMVTLSEFVPAADYFFNTPDIKKEDVLSQSEHSEEETKKWFNTVQDILQNESDFTATKLHDELGKAQFTSGLTPRQAFMSLRFAISGRSVTPQLFDCFVILGKEETIKRLSSIFS